MGTSFFDNPVALVGLLLLLVAPPITFAAAHPLDVDRTTPRRALRVFIDSAREGDWGAAAQVLDPLAVAAAGPTESAPRLARQLKLVLDTKLWIDWEKVSDDPAGDPRDGDGADLVGSVAVDDTAIPVRLVRQADGTWRFGNAITSAIPRLYERYGPGWVGDHLPRRLVETSFLDVQAWQWTGLLLALALSAVVSLLVGAVVQALASRAARRTRFDWDDRLVERMGGPARLAMGIGLFGALERALRLAVPAQQLVEHASRVVLVLTFAWTALRAIAFAADLGAERLARVDGDTSTVRARATQVMVLKRVCGFVVVVVAGALVLMQFDALRAIGASLLASAGVAGLVLGLAAQRTIGAVISGIQLSLAQPVRVGDVVVVDGAWGTVEEITLTYVVVKVWDLRRLVVPIKRFFDASFENWTKTGSRILGTAFVYADYRVPVADVRRELERFVQDRPEWDGEVVGLQVTNASEHAVELRALVSSADASRSWDLRCSVREHLIDFLQRLDGGRYLPRTRIEASGGRNTARLRSVEDAGGPSWLPSRDGSAP